MRPRRFVLRALTSGAIAVLLTSSLSVPPAAAGNGNGGNGNGNANLHLDKTVATAGVSQNLSLTLSADRSSALPGDTIAYTATVTNTGATMTLTGDLTAGNTNATTATISSYWDAISTTTTAHCGAGGDNNGKNDSQWPAFAGVSAAQPGYVPVDMAPIATGMTLVATGVAADGVTYPDAAATDQILGTQLAPGATATWHYTATLALSPDQAAFLFDPLQVSRIRNSFHAEPTPRDQGGNGQPARINTEFCQVLRAGNPSAAASDVRVVLTLPDGTTRTVTSATVPALASLAAGSSATVNVGYTLPVAAAKGEAETDAAYLARLHSLDAKPLAASATAQIGEIQPSATAGPVTSTEHLPILTLAKTGPEQVDAGKTATYDLVIANTGSAAATPALTDSLPADIDLPVTDVPATLAAGATATAHSTYEVPKTQPAGDLTDTATLTWTDANAKPYGPIGASATTTVKPAYNVAHLTIEPTLAGPFPLGMSHTWTISATDAAGNPSPAVPLTLTISGPEARTIELVTDDAGRATGTITGSAEGTDVAQAEIEGLLSSNTASVIWMVPIAQISTTAIHGTFYPAGVLDNTFTATPASTPLFEQDFPSINFDPPTGAVLNNKSGVNENTRPFTDVTTGIAGEYTGTIVASGNGHSAGSGDMISFDAVFTGNYTIAQAGDYNFDFYSDDGWMFGIGGAATRVSGPMTNPPASGKSVFAAYDLVASYNTNSSPTAKQLTVHFPAPGVYPFEIDYFESHGGQAVLTVTLHDTGKAIPAMGSLTLSPPSPISLNQGVTGTYTAAAMDAAGNPIAGLPVSFSVNGVNSIFLTGTTDANGLVDFSYTSFVSGNDRLAATAYLAAQPILSNAVSQSWSGLPPQPSITNVSPAEGAVLTAPTPITATFAPPTGMTFRDWQVTYRRLNTGTDIVLASGTGTPPETLATLDPTVLDNGSYTIAIKVSTSAYTSQTLTFGVIVDGALKLGRYQVTYKDADVAVGGIPISVLRTYDSFDKSNGDFGIGWRLSVANFRVYSNAALGQSGWSQYATNCIAAGLGGGLCTMAWQTARPHYVTVVWPDGHTETFDFTPSGGSNLFWFGQAAFTGRSGATSKLAVDGESTVSYFGNGNLYAGLTQNTIYAPTRFRLTGKDGTVYVLDATAGLVSATDRLGNTVTIDSTGIHSSLGPSITFTRAGDGRITALTKPDGSVVTYGTTYPGNLTSVTDERGYRVTYQYDSESNLTKTIDPNGKPMRVLTYGPDGRLATVTDGEGTVTTIDVDPTARAEVVTGPDPRLTTVSSMNERGDIVRVDQTFGGRTLTTRFTYDDQGDVLSKTDPAGHVTRATYNAANSQLTLTEPDGGAWTFTYNDHEQLTSIKDRTGRTIATLTYDEYGELTKKTTADGDTRYTYDPRGLLASVTDPLNRTTTYGYDSAGRATSVTGPDLRVWHYAYDADGRTKTITTPASEQTSFDYDLSGNLTGFTNAEGHGQTYAYDALGRLTAATDGLGHATTSAYDLASRLKSVLDRNGETTRFEYNAAGQATRLTLPDGSTVAYTYDPLGQLTDANNADATLHFVYDDEGNLASQTSGGTATSAQPTVTLTFGRDPAGRPTSLATPWGTTHFGYNANGLLASVADPSGGDFTFAYDPVGRLKTLTRPNGVDDTYAYDAAGQSVVADFEEGRLGHRFPRLRIRRLRPSDQQDRRQRHDRLRLRRRRSVD